MTIPSHPARRSPGRLPVFRFLLGGVLLGTLIGCAAFDPFDAPPIRANPEDLYEFEAACYPNSTWSYLGSDSRWHYLSPLGRDEDEVIHGLFTDYKLARRYLPEVEGYPYDAEDPRSTRVDVEVHPTFIRIEIAGEPAQQIPFESPGFVTADHRRSSSSKPPGNAPFPAPRASITDRKARLSGSGERVTTRIHSDGQVELPEAGR